MEQDKEQLWGLLCAAFSFCLSFFFGCPMETTRDEFQDQGLREREERRPTATVMTAIMAKDFWCHFISPKICRRRGQTSTWKPRRKTSSCLWETSKSTRTSEQKTDLLPKLSPSIFFSRNEMQRLKECGGRIELGNGNFRSCGNKLCAWGAP